MFLDASQIIVLDEFGTNITMTRPYARSPRGQRVTKALPRTTPKNTTIISSLTLNGIGSSFIVEGSVNSQVFETYIEKVLGPTLKPSQIIVLDNLSSHRTARVKELVASFQCQLLFLPPYSPDLSPIELAFSKIKNELRRIGPRTLEELKETIAATLPLISSDNAFAFFKHCGYFPKAEIGQ